ncbi:MAG: CDP-6-deoxy-delta-3,4-glucoseen reductase [Lautropia sp.]
MAFRISVLPSGSTFAGESGETILSAAIRQGIGMPYGCRDGVCGSCKCKLLEGIVVHGERRLEALSGEEEAAGYVLACCAVPQADIVLESRQVTDGGAFPIRKMPTRVLSLEKKSHDVMRVRLQFPTQERMHYQAGQYIEFVLRDGARRAYSMATAPHNGPIVELHVRHMPGGRFTDHVFSTMKEKDILRAEGPYGAFFLRENSEKPMVLLASGTGFAPIKAIIEYLQFKEITRPAVLYWGGRRPADLYLSDWVATRVAEMPNLFYEPVVSDATPADDWTGRTGFVHKAVLQDFPDLSGHQVYACGAPIVVDSARAEFCAQAGLPPEEFFADAFVTSADKPKASA